MHITCTAALGEIERKSLIATYKTGFSNYTIKKTQKPQHSELERQELQGDNKQEQY